MSPIFIIKARAENIQPVAESGNSNKTQTSEYISVLGRLESGFGIKRLRLSTAAPLDRIGPGTIFYYYRAAYLAARALWPCPNKSEACFGMAAVTRSSGLANEPAAEDKIFFSL